MTPAPAKTIRHQRGCKRLDSELARTVMILRELYQDGGAVELEATFSTKQVKVYNHRKTSSPSPPHGNARFLRSGQAAVATNDNSLAQTASLDRSPRVSPFLS